ncbi:Dolichol phosphate-mannose biosynthesis regulatory protein [Naganishia albida]|nr:Dolichol phosphate-mannose biosynthesis regulatory protein [Naganishia albida]
MATSDKLLGSIMLFVAIFVFSYYTVWALLTPFLDPSSTIHGYFPPREYAVRLPASLLVLGGAVVALFIGNVMWKESRKRKLRAGKAA